MEETDFFSNGESNLPPSPEEPICLVSYEIAMILLGGGPENRSSFWKAYRRELELNRKTSYQNYHVNLCSAHLKSLRIKPTGPVFFRGNKLVTEKEVDPFSLPLLPH
jgi:hypothetical protein